MADLSAVLRKTIDGLPRQTPALREKVYEKARAAIVRQIETADPPLGEDVVAARRGALEDAIARTESHYTGLESPAEDTAPEAASAAPAPVPAAPPRATPPAAPPQATRPAPPPP
ncbi:histidine kinase, partial [Aurantimonas sp. MSK8Z-1]|nr:histidine kinase [Aurantimonas sp. MSK8Z-1]